MVWKLDRIGRSFKHLIDLIERFKKEDVHFVSLHENVDMTTATGKLMFNIMASLAEFERDMIIERTRAAFDAARARGNGGRPAKHPRKVNLALSMYDSKQFTIVQIEQAIGLKINNLQVH